MKFIVTRTSNYWNYNSPCNEAYEEEIEYTDICDFSSVEENDKYAKMLGVKSWTQQGTNHRIEGGKPVRTITEKKWIVDLATLEDLLNFINKYDRVVVDNAKGYYAWIYPTIEIYDDWRE